MTNSGIFIAIKTSIELICLLAIHLLVSVNVDVVMIKKITIGFCQLLSVQDCDQKGAEFFMGKLA